MRAKVRRPKRRGGSSWFYSALAVIIVGFIVLLAFVKTDNGNTDVPPRPTNSATGEVGDHWHEAYGVNVCGDWLDFKAVNTTTVADNPNVYAGLHSHGDGYIHEEPASLSESGDNATLGRWLDYMGFSYSGDTFKFWSGPGADPAKAEWKTGDECPPGTPFEGQKGVVKWALNCQANNTDPNKHKLHDHEVVAFAFLPKGEEPGTPPTADEPVSEGSGSFKFKGKGCKTAGPGVTTTTSAAGATTTTTAATTTTTRPS